MLVSARVVMLKSVTGSRGSALACRAIPGQHVTPFVWMVTMATTVPWPASVTERELIRVIICLARASVHPAGKAPCVNQVSMSLCMYVCVCVCVCVCLCVCVCTRNREILAL